MTLPCVCPTRYSSGLPFGMTMSRFKPRADEQFFLDKFLVKFIFSCARQTIFFINFSVTSFTSLHVADTSKYFTYFYYIGLKTNQTLILHLQIKAFPCQFFLVGLHTNSFPAGSKAGMTRFWTRLLVKENLSFFATLTSK